MRRIDTIIIHCSATKEGAGITMENIRDWHVNGNEWNDIGYHYVIEDDGKIRMGRPIHQRGAHARGQNGSSVGVCYTGGLNATGKGVAGPNKAQSDALRALVDALTIVFPTIEAVIGHRDTGANKDCPSFDVEEWMRTGVATPSRNLA